MKQSWNRARKILCVRLDTIGDVLMTTPAIRALKESAPKRHITLLTSPTGAEAAALVPEIDAIITYEAPWMKATATRTDSGPVHAMIEHIRDQSFDAAVIFTVYSQNPLPAAFACYLADIPLRLAHCHENPYQLLTNWVPDPEPDRIVRHEVRRQLDLVGEIDCRTDDERLSLAVPKQARRRVLGMLDALNIDREAPWAVVHPGATAPSRRYPPEHFAEVTRRLGGDNNWQLVFTGTAGEEKLVEEIRTQAGTPTSSLVGRLSLGELAVLIEEAPLLISNNTGPVHVAAAVGTPTVDIYALTNVQHAPWAVPSRVLFHDVPCRLCYKSVCPEEHHNCLRLVTPEAVVQAACELFEESSRAVVGTRGDGAPPTFTVDRLIHPSDDVLHVAGRDVT